jgi:hypothetical protein
MSTADARPPRGRVELYAGAFVLLVAAAYVLARGNIQSSLRYVWLSMALSGVAAVAAVVSVYIRARARSDTAPEAAESASEDSRDSSPRQAKPASPDAGDPAPG